MGDQSGWNGLVLFLFAGAGLFFVVMVAGWFADAWAWFRKRRERKEAAP